MKIPKLLSPVRNKTSFQAAIQAGADAVYFGLGELNMRLSSEGIKLAELSQIVKLAHNKKVKVYATLNVIIYGNELLRLQKLLQEIKKAKADAVICWDLAVIQECLKLKIPFHISTQASISNSASAQFYEKLGARAIVLARECTLQQIKQIKSKVKCKIEVFCHGAMCVSVSGRCFLSQFLHCKSANRGECLQPCRQEYEVKDQRYGHKLKISNGYIMSPKDLRTLRILEQIICSGVDVLKIEGRDRSAEYIYIVTKAYKTAIQAISQNQYTDKLKNKLIAEVSKVYNHGFSNGFLFGYPGDLGWAKTSDSQAVEKKEYLGKVSNYFKKTKIAEIALNSGNIQANDLIQIQGQTTGVLRLKIKNPQKHPQGEITFICPKTVRRSDEVYKIINK